MPYHFIGGCIMVNKKSYERLFEVVYILFLIIVILTTAGAGLAGVDSVMDNGMYDYFNPTELKTVLVRNITHCSLEIIGSIFRTAIVVWAELKFSLVKTISLCVIISLQISATLFLIYRLLAEIAMAIARLV